MTTYTLTNIYAIAVRVLRQLAHDRRFVALSLGLPLAICFMLYFFFDGVDAPYFDPQTFVLSVGGYIVHLIAYALCAIAIVKERTAQTLGRMFVNGYLQVEVIGGYILAYSLLATVQSLLVLASLHLIFDLPYGLGTMVAVYFVMWMLALISIALGIFISNFARTESQVFPFIPLVIMVSVLFSGVILPIEKLPEWIRWLHYTTPVYYANGIIQALIKPGGVLGDAGGDLAGLVIYGVILFSMATVTLREME